MNVMTRLAIGLTAVLGIAVVYAGGDATPPGEYYTVVDGRVDRATYTGWQIFVQNCSACHGAGAAGSSLAPALTERINWLSIVEFRAKVLSRYFISVPVQDAVSEGSEAVREAMEESAGQAQAREQDLVSMPPWRNNPDVRNHIDELYAYLTARADGAIGPEAPEVVEP